MRKYQENKRLSRDPERDRMREIYTIKEITQEEKQERLKQAYAHIYYQAFGTAITTERLKSLEGIEE
jgi:tryptophanase